MKFTVTYLSAFLFALSLWAPSARAFSFGENFVSPGILAGFASTPQDRGRGHFHPGPGWRPGVPYRVSRGPYPWPAWRHPVMAWPRYFWNWGRLTSLTCSAEDSGGHLFPVNQFGYRGQVYQFLLPGLQDAALNRCYAETGGDPDCRPVGCTPFY